MNDGSIDDNAVNNIQSINPFSFKRVEIIFIDSHCLRGNKLFIASCRLCIDRMLYICHAIFLICKTYMENDIHLYVKYKKTLQFSKLKLYFNR